MWSSDTESSNQSTKAESIPFQDCKPPDDFIPYSNELFAKLQQEKQELEERYKEANEQINFWKEKHELLLGRQQLQNDEVLNFQQQLEEVEEKCIELTLQLDKTVKNELTEQARLQCREAFNVIDTNGDGLLELDEYLRLIANLNVDITETEAHRYFCAMDDQDLGYVEYPEFEVAFIDTIASLIMYETKEQTTVYETPRCLERQALYDLESHTTLIITKFEKNVCRLSQGGWVKRSCMEQGKLQFLTGFEKHICREAFNSIDTNGDGQISYSEYKSLIDNLRIFESEEKSRTRFDLMDPYQDGTISFLEFESTFVDKLIDIMHYVTCRKTQVYESGLGDSNHIVIYELEKGEDVIIINLDRKFAQIGSGGFVLRTDIVSSTSGLCPGQIVDHADGKKDADAWDWEPVKPRTTPSWRSSEMENHDSIGSVHSSLCFGLVSVIAILKSLIGKESPVLVFVKIVGYGQEQQIFCLPLVGGIQLWNLCKNRRS